MGTPLAEAAAVVELVGTTSATANAETLTLALGVPPVGTRWRLVALLVAADSASSQPVIARLVGATTGTTFLVAGGPPAPTVGATVVPLGVHLETREEVRLGVVSPGTNVPWRAIVLYVFEAG